MDECFCFNSLWLSRYIFFDLSLQIKSSQEENRKNLEKSFQFEKKFIFVKFLLWKF